MGVLQIILAIYGGGAFLFFMGSMLWLANSYHVEDRKFLSLFFTNILLWPLITIGFIIWCCIAGIKYHIKAFNDHMPK